MSSSAATLSTATTTSAMKMWWTASYSAPLAKDAVAGGAAAPWAFRTGRGGAGLSGSRPATSAGGGAKRSDSVALEMAPSTAAPTVLPSERQNMLVAVTTP